MKRICYAAIVLWAGLPALMAQAANQILGSGYTGPNVPGVSAGQVITLFVAPLNVPDAVATQIPLPTSLSGVSVSVRIVDEGETVLDSVIRALFCIRLNDTTDASKPIAVRSSRDPGPVHRLVEAVAAAIPCPVYSFDEAGVRWR